MKLKHFNGWFPLDEHTPMGKEDVLVYLGGGTSEYHTPESGSKISSKWIGVTRAQAVEKWLNPSYWPYRKGKGRLTGNELYDQPLPLP